MNQLTPQQIQQLAAMLAQQQQQAGAGGQPNLPPGLNLSQVAQAMNQPASINANAPTVLANPATGQIPGGTTPGQSPGGQGWPMQRVPVPNVGGPARAAAIEHNKRVEGQKNLNAQPGTRGTPTVEQQALINEKEAERQAKIQAGKDRRQGIIDANLQRRRDKKAAEAARIAELKAKQRARKAIRGQGGTVVEGELEPGPFKQLPASTLTDSLIA
jgi:hypothetical protein